MKTIFKYNDFLTESALIELIMESKVIYSKRFINLLTLMKSKIATDLLSIYSN